MSTVVIQDTQSLRFRAVMLKGHVSLLALGMRNSQFSGTAILKAVTEVTGVTYKRGQYAAAKADLVKFLEDTK